MIGLMYQYYSLEREIVVQMVSIIVNFLSKLALYVEGLEKRGPP